MPFENRPRVDKDAGHLVCRQRARNGHGGNVFLVFTAAGGEMTPKGRNVERVYFYLIGSVVQLMNALYISAFLLKHTHTQAFLKEYCDATLVGVKEEKEY